MKKFITVAATIAMVALGTMTAVAANKGWYQDANTVWHFADKDGEDVCEKWEGNYFLNEDGDLAVNTIFDFEDNYYCVDENGVKACNAWAFTNVLDKDEEPVWMWFKANGKAVKEGWVTVGGTKFLFDEYAMQTGFIDADDNVIDKDDDEAWQDAVKYCTENGMYKGWLKVDTEDDFAWIYFGTNGKKVTGKKNIDGIVYNFDEETGAMADTWFVGTPASAKFANADGSVLRNGWIYTEASGSDSGESNWFYFKGGELVTNQIKKINDKWYAFDWEGKMLTGFVSVDFASKQVCGAPAIAAADVETVEGFFNSLCMGSHTNYMYFTENDDPMLQGAAVTGKTTLKLALGEKTFNFDKNGVIKFASGSDVVAKIVKNYLYVGGILMADADSDYKFMPAKINGTLYVVNIQTGKCYTKGSHIDSANEVKFVFENSKIAIYKKNAEGKWAFDQYFVPTV